VEVDLPDDPGVVEDGGGVGADDAPSFVCKVFADLLGVDDDVRRDGGQQLLGQRRLAAAALAEDR
jgi:hypothetical protein